MEKQSSQLSENVSKLNSGSRYKRFRECRHVVKFRVALSLPFLLRARRHPAFSNGYSLQSAAPVED